MTITISDGVAHKVPSDLRAALKANRSALEKWQSLTPLARNEWICWVVTVKQQETRDNHIDRTITELNEGVRRPCCWLGCIHRTDKQMSPSQKFIVNRQSKSN